MGDSDFHTPPDTASSFDREGFSGLIDRLENPPSDYETFKRRVLRQIDLVYRQHAAVADVDLSRLADELDFDDLPEVRRIDKLAQDIFSEGRLQNMGYWTLADQEKRLYGALMMPVKDGLDKDDPTNLTCLELHCLGDDESNSALKVAYSSVPAFLKKHLPEDVAGNQAVVASFPLSNARGTRDGRGLRVKEPLAVEVFESYSALRDYMTKTP